MFGNCMTTTSVVYFLTKEVHENREVRVVYVVSNGVTRPSCSGGT